MPDFLTIGTLASRQCTLFIFGMWRPPTERGMLSCIDGTPHPNKIVFQIAFKAMLCFAMQVTECSEIRATFPHWRETHRLRRSVPSSGMFPTEEKHIATSCTYVSLSCGTFRNLEHYVTIYVFLSSAEFFPGILSRISLRNFLIKPLMKALETWDEDLLKKCSSTI